MLPASARSTVPGVSPCLRMGGGLKQDGKGNDDSMSPGSGTITRRYAAVPIRRVEAVVEKWV